MCDNINVTNYEIHSRISQLKIPHRNNWLVHNTHFIWWWIHYSICRQDSATLHNCKCLTFTPTRDYHRGLFIATQNNYFPLKFYHVSCSNLLGPTYIPRGNYILDTCKAKIGSPLRYLPCVIQYTYSPNLSRLYMFSELILECTLFYKILTSRIPHKTDGVFFTVTYTCTYTKTKVSGPQCYRRCLFCCKPSISMYPTLL